MQQFGIVQYAFGSTHCVTPPRFLPAVAFDAGWMGVRRAAGKAHARWCGEDILVYLVVDFLWKRLEAFPNAVNAGRDVGHGRYGGFCAGAKMELEDL